MCYITKTNTTNELGLKKWMENRLSYFFFISANSPHFTFPVVPATFILPRSRILSRLAEHIERSSYSFCVFNFFFSLQQHQRRIRKGVKDHHSPHSPPAKYNHSWNPRPFEQIADVFLEKPIAWRWPEFVFLLCRLNVFDFQLGHHCTQITAANIILPCFVSFTIWKFLTRGIGSCWCKQGYHPDGDVRLSQYPISTIRLKDALSRRNRNKRSGGLVVGYSPGRL